MIAVILSAWAISSFIAILLALMIIKDQGTDIKDKENVWLLVIAMWFPALLFMGVAGAAGHNVIVDRRSRRVRTIIRQWENVSVDHATRLKAKASESGYLEVIEDMRGNMKSLTLNDLKLLASMNEDPYKLDKVILDAVIDELLERQLLQ